MKYRQISYMLLFNFFVKFKLITYIFTMGDASFFYLLFFTMLTLSMAAENEAGVWQFPIRRLIAEESSSISIYPLPIEGPFQWILVEVVYPDGTFCRIVPVEWLYFIPPVVLVSLLSCVLFSLYIFEGVVLIS